jgi:threonine synthase
MNHDLKKCINPSCGLTYGILNSNYQCSCGSFLDILYKEKPHKQLIEKFYQRRNLMEIFTMKVAYGDFENY